mmetsp:Transcript_64627/g.129841  ORF Transcript_64627/g.129841 Transcript_64627/m.129841 type:complete len:321 (+) Transcript_64627:2-964(+)
MPYASLWELAWASQCGGSYWVVHPLPVAVGGDSEKNAVTNLELMQAAARLHLLTGERRYADQAQQIWDWLAAAPLRDADGLLGDGLTGTAGFQSDCCNGTAPVAWKPRCMRNGVPSYTYNQGLFVGGAKLMYRITGDYSYIDEAQRTLRAVLHRMTARGVLREPLEGTLEALAVTCDANHDPAGGDLYSFKGVFMLQLADFLQGVPLDSALRAQLVGLVARSSDAAWGLRNEPPWSTSQLDVCADPSLARLLSGPPKFPWYWVYVGRPNATPARRVCMDARTQISALSLFAAHFLVAGEAAGSEAFDQRAASGDELSILL